MDCGGSWSGWGRRENDELVDGRRRKKEEKKREWETVVEDDIKMILGTDGEEWLGFKEEN